MHNTVIKSKQMGNRMASRPVSSQVLVRAKSCSRTVIFSVFYTVY